MYHLAAYFASLAAGPNLSVPGLVDPVLTRSATSNLYIFPQTYMLLGAFAASPLLTRARLNSPTLRQINPPMIRPINVAQLPASNALLAWWADQPYKLPALEEVGPEISNSAAGPSDSYVLIWFADQVIPVPAGQIITARATATFAATANAWTLGSFVFDQSLPSGNYALVGSECISTTGIAHRWAFPNQMFRPGSLSHNAVGDQQDWRLLTRRLGMMGQFLNTAPPNLEVLCRAADAAHEIYMQLIPLSGQLGSM